MKPGNALDVAGLLLFAALCELVCELVCELLRSKPSLLPIWIAVASDFGNPRPLAGSAHRAADRT
jgi:hypothetical protein